MKKLYTIILVVLSLFAFTSCNDFLDMKQTNSVDSKGSVTTARDAEVAINGLVREMLITSLYGRNTLLYADAKGGIGLRASLAKSIFLENASQNLHLHFSRMRL